MKLPRDFSGGKTASLLTRYYSYRLTRSKGSHCCYNGNDRQQPAQGDCASASGEVRVVMLDPIVTDMAEFLGQLKCEVRDHTLQVT